MVSPPYAVLLRDIIIAAGLATCLYVSVCVITTVLIGQDIGFGRRGLASYWQQIILRHRLLNLSFAFLCNSPYSLLFHLLHYSLGGEREGRFLRGPRGQALPRQFLGWVFSSVVEAGHDGGR